MDNIGIVVESLDNAIAFFLEIGLKLEGRAMIEGEWAGRVTGLGSQKVEIAMMVTPDGHSRLELSRFLEPATVADHRTAPVNSLGYLRAMFAVENIDELVGRLTKQGAELVGEVVRYENSYRLCYVRGAEGILVGLAEQLWIGNFEFVSRFPRERLIWGMTPSHKPYLLLVDDDPDDILLFSDAIRQNNSRFSVQTLGGGKELLQFLERCTPQALPTLLLLDYQLNDLNGPELLKIFKAHPLYKNIRTVMWSTSRRVKDMEVCLQLGAVHYFIKPAGNEELQVLVRDITGVFEGRSV
jgi:CheY-like chemotaxis protein/catechol 2,3-dioxygenase-like lactoylglutathione lyase family enzyme